jgi:amphi-Trp domain-containing protein
MSMATDEFQHESLQDLKSIGEYLRAIVQGLENGHIELSDDSGQLVLHPSGLLGLELRAKQKGNRAKLVIELSWTEDKGKTRAESLRVRTESTD